MDSIDNQPGLAGINRYIVGCKFVNEQGKTTIAVGINRYIVGCKLTMDRI